MILPSCFCFMACLVVAQGSQVLRFPHDEATDKVSDKHFTIQWAGLVKLLISQDDVKPQGSKVGTVSWNTCGKPPSGHVHLTGVHLIPDPLQSGKTSHVSFTGLLVERLFFSMDAAVLLEYKAGSAWYKVICSGNVGSCTYRDICKMFKCPSDKGIFTINTLFTVPKSLRPATYRMTVTLKYHLQWTACFQFIAEIK